MVCCGVFAGSSGASQGRTLASVQLGKRLEATAMVIVALDVGAARIGVADCDELELLAAPRATIQRKTTAGALDAVVAEIGRAGAELVVVGLPISFDGQLHGQARAVQSFATKLARRISVPLVYFDETLSSARAEERLREAGVRGPRIRERIDAEAAAVILGDFLDQRRRERATRLNDSMREGQEEDHDS
jgi:putative holliday junction resolvase